MRTCSPLSDLDMVISQTGTSQDLRQHSGSEFEIAMKPLARKRTLIEVCVTASYNVRILDNEKSRDSVEYEFQNRAYSRECNI